MRRTEGDGLALSCRESPCLGQWAKNMPQIVDIDHASDCGHRPCLKVWISMPQTESKESKATLRLGPIIFGKVLPTIWGNLFHNLRQVRCLESEGRSLPLI